MALFVASVTDTYYAPSLIQLPLALACILRNGPSKCSGSSRWTLFAFCQASLWPITPGRARVTRCQRAFIRVEPWGACLAAVRAEDVAEASGAARTTAIHSALVGKKCPHCMARTLTCLLKQIFQHHKQRKPSSTENTVPGKHSLILSEGTHAAVMLHVPLLQGTLLPLSLGLHIKSVYQAMPSLVRSASSTNSFPRPPWICRTSCTPSRSPYEGGSRRRLDFVELPHPARQTQVIDVHRQVEQALQGLRRSQ